MISSYLYMVIPGKFGTNYYICQGLDPKIDEYDVDKVKNLEENNHLKNEYFSYLVPYRHDWSSKYNMVSVPKYQGLQI